jgi:hypothetical protein
VKIGLPGVRHHIHDEALRCSLIPRALSLSSQVMRRGEAQSNCVLVDKFVEVSALLGKHPATLANEITKSSCLEDILKQVNRTPLLRVVCCRGRLAVTTAEPAACGIQPAGCNVSPLHTLTLQNQLTAFSPGQHRAAFECCLKLNITQ